MNQLQNNTIETVTSSQSNDILLFKSKLELEKLFVKDLEGLCAKYGLSKTGNKAKLVEKISNYQEKLPTKNPNTSICSQVNNDIGTNSSQESSKPAVSQKELMINGTFIQVRYEDGYINATQLAKAMGKRFNDWYELKSTKELLDQLSSEVGIPVTATNAVTGIPVKATNAVTGIPVTALVQIIQGGNNKNNQGSWIHPDLVVPMAQWGSPKYAITVLNYQKKLPAFVSSCPGTIVSETESSQESSKPVVSQKPIIPLKLTDVFQLTYRQSDGYVDVTDLCKAGGREFKTWKRSQKTQDFLAELSRSVQICTDLLCQTIVSGNNENRGTWAHPQVAINIAQWISPKFDVLVSKWVYEIVLTGKVDVSQPKTSADLLQLQQQLADTQNLLLSKNKEIEKLSTSLIINKRHHSYHKFKNGPVFYIISDANYTNCKCDIRRFVKIGIEDVDINTRLRHHRTTLPALKIDFLMYTEDNRLIEKNILRKYRKDLKPFLNHEIVFGIDKDKIIKNVLALTKFLNIEYTLEEDIEKYNSVIQLLVDSEESKEVLDSDSDELESIKSEEIFSDDNSDSDIELEEKVPEKQILMYKCIKCLQEKKLSEEFFREYHGSFLKMCLECEKRKTIIPASEIKPGMKTKRCNICQGIFSIDDFQKNRTRADGLECACRNCSCLRKNPNPSKRWTMKKPEMTSDQLYCPRCEKIKMKTCFKTSVSRPNGYQCYCVECASEIGKKYPKVKNI